jgi:hypothetical protein
MTLWYAEFNEGQGPKGARTTVTGRRWVVLRTDLDTPAAVRASYDPQGVRLRRVQRVERRAEGASLAKQLELEIAV